ncbi:hypothetical protein [Campylobacter hyointestinalis]|uniref:hypothetical protein n=1 Tax=Campylobacter hyointestinalis TaxID=198 RepID=UPI001478DA26|nr:hypothetical protein [Campylobacter hyointestinalis]
MLKNENILFANLDYKDLLKEMSKQNILVDCILTDPPIAYQENISLAFQIWAEAVWTMEIGREYNPKQPKHY